MPERTGTNVGCEYFAVPLPNTSGSFLGQDPFQFRVLLSNPNSQPAHVEITRAGIIVAAERIEARSSAVVPLSYNGQQDPVGINGRLRSGLVDAGAYRIISDQPVTAAQFGPFEYALAQPPSGPAGDHFIYSSDASLLLPSHALGRHYVGATYVPTSSRITGWGGIGGRYVSADANAGYLVIVGLTDEPTTVRVRPSAPLAGGAGIANVAASELLTLRLGRGEVAILVHSSAELCEPGRPGYVTDDEPVCRPLSGGGEACRQGEYCREHTLDLTGTRIDSERPVAVFGGHQCAFVPYDRWACDHLESQLPPIRTLGRTYVGAPLREPSSDGPNLVRIVAVEDGTQVSLSPESLGISQHPLEAGEVLEIEIDTIYRVEATKRVLVEQLMIGQGPLESASGAPLRGDPSLMIVPPSEQYRSDYDVTLPSSYREATNGQNYLLITRSAGTLVEIDGVPIEGRVESLGDIEALVVAVPGGAHHVRADAEIGVVMFGMGSYTSYATPAGLGLRTLLF